LEALTARTGHTCGRLLDMVLLAHGAHSQSRVDTGAFSTAITLHKWSCQTGARNPRGHTQWVHDSIWQL